MGINSNLTLRNRKFAPEVTFVFHPFKFAQNITRWRYKLAASLNCALPLNRNSECVLLLTPMRHEKRVKIGLY